MEKSKIEFAEITIINWEEFQKRRTDVKVSHWFKLSNRIFYNDKIQCLSNIELILYLILLSVASENDSKSIRVSTEHIMRLNRIRTRRLYYQALETLVRNGQITCSLRQTRLDQTRLEETRRDETREEESPSLTLGTNTGAKKKKPKSPSLTLGANNANAFVARYCENFKLRYGVNPVITGRDAGICKRLTKSLSDERLETLIATYFKMNESWFLQKRHDLSTFENNLNAVVKFANDGESLNRIEMQNREKENYWAAQAQKIEKGSL